nr:TlpA disulfide reductase family protein [Sphingomonas sp. Y57]
MDGVFQLGSLALAADRLFAVVALWLFLSLGAWIGKRTGSGAGRVAWMAALAGIVAARIAYVVENRTAFAVDPWAALAFWQGGFTLWAGAAAGAIMVILLLGRRQRAMVALLASLAALLLAHAGLSHWLAAPVRPLPQGVVLTGMDGRKLPLDHLRGRPFVINLWASWCGPCRREMPMLIDVASRSDVPILLVNQRETPSTVAAFLERERLPISSIVIDPAGVMGDAARVQGFPTTLFVDGSARIRSIQVGEISRAALVAAIRDLQRSSK